MTIHWRSALENCRSRCAQAGDVHNGAVENDHQVGDPQHSGNPPPPAVVRTTSARVWPPPTWSIVINAVIRCSVTGRRSYRVPHFLRPAEEPTEERLAEHLAGKGLGGSRYVDGARPACALLPPGNVPGRQPNKLDPAAPTDQGRHEVDRWEMRSGTDHAPVIGLANARPRR